MFKFSLLRVFYDHSFECKFICKNVNNTPILAILVLRLYIKRGFAYATIYVKNVTQFFLRFVQIAGGKVADKIANFGV